ncbi:ATP-dependent 3'-5' DNA helicase [Saccharomyces pastorianus]|uniref:DNA 3'-5' helicase n=1 Tax=Saccharomyces pastorianus TaxID=27292 RepID=A0A6C1E3Q4_SACPS|nr:ATP-dependent 3'-5' DNA helicase [Saccharomyces pastorianus]
MQQEPPNKKAKLVHEGTKKSDDFKNFEQFFFRLNTLYTFLICRKHVVPTFKTLCDPIGAALKRAITKEDLARVMALMPRDCVFKYIDENQIYTETKIFDFNNGGFQQKENDIFELKDAEDQYERGRSTQLLIFEFIDGTMQRSWSASDKFSQVKIPTYTTEEMKKMISKREVLFESRLQEFILENEKLGLDPFFELTKLAQKYIPKERDYEDPIEAMMKAKQEGAEMVIPDDSGNPGIATIPQMIEKLKHTEFYASQIKHCFTIPSRIAAYKDLSFELAPEVYQGLEHNRFYSHQADAINALHRGENVIITTSTSSGKSLIYQLAAIDLLLKDSESTFMYIFPTKALAQDQKRAFKVILSKIPELKNIVVDTYDGDTESSERVYIRKNARVIFTNPDMIHTSVLPNHANWRHFLYHLKLVVVDELHIYKGLFGSHVALVMRRLLRLCHFFYENTNLQFISCSATLKSPIQHMKDMFGINEVTLIHEDGSPTGAKHLVVWNPPTLSQHERKRESFIRESAKILVQLVLNNVRAIAFCYVRRVCELLMKEVRSIFTEIGREDLITEVMSYRGGYSASDRRKIEREMFHGNLKAVISTNALELGIDIGGLDAVLMCGFPLSMANFHQQSGRAGRRNNDSLTLVVASDSPVDQHYVAHPESLLEVDNSNSFQELILDFDNILILEGHIQCAAFELPINFERDKEFFAEAHLRRICVERLHHNQDGYHASNRFLPWPSKRVSLRGGEEDQFAVVDITNGRNIIIEEIEASRTSFTLYDGGIFIHQGYPYLVKEFNPDERYAKVQRVDVDWVTSQRDFTDVDPQEIELIRSLESSDVPVYFGKIKTTIVVFGFFKMDKYKRIIDAIETHNPPVIINSKGFWIDIPKRVLDICQKKQLNVAGAIHGAQHAIMGMLPRFIVAGVDEIQTECKAPEKEFAERQTKRRRPARLVFYDSKGGKYGSGLSIKAFEHVDDIIESSLKRISECPCSDGCPDCVAASFCKENSLVLSKPGAQVVLHCILGHMENDFIDSIKDGPEPNMPEIKVETVVPVSEHVNFSEDFKIIDVRKTTEDVTSSSDVIKEEK